MLNFVFLLNGDSGIMDAPWGNVWKAIATIVWDTAVVASVVRGHGASTVWDSSFSNCIKEDMRLLFGLVDYVT